MSLRDFAAYLGVSDRTVSNWEGGRAGYQPRAESQAVAGGAAPFVPSAAAKRACASSDAWSSAVSSTRAGRLRADMRPSAHDEWLESSWARLDHPEAQQCVLHVFACGVAVFHLVQPHMPAALTDLAVWRYRSYASDLPWARDKLRDLLDEEPARVPSPEYVLSLYWLTSGPWSGDAHDTALRLLSAPSVLVDRSAPDGPAPLGCAVEESLLATGFDHPDIVAFGVRGVSTAYAGRSGVAYASYPRERSRTIDELVTCELTVQALWCFTRQVQQMIEDGQDPFVAANADEDAWPRPSSAWLAVDASEAHS